MKNEIQKIFKGDADDSEETLVKYSHDASLLEVRPKIVLFPKDSQDVQNLVKWVNENKTKYTGLSITARCAGTDMSGGAIGESIILDFTRYMNKLVSFTSQKNSDAFIERDVRREIYDVGNSSPQNHITVEPGMFYRDFEKITLEKGLILPCYTASKSLNAMGGMYGNNSAGERTLKYGKMEDYIISAKVIFADGNEYVVKALNKDELDKKIAQGDFEGNVYKNIFNLYNDNKEKILQAKPNVSKNSAGYYIWNVVTNSDINNYAGGRFTPEEGGKPSNYLHPSKIEHLKDLSGFLHPAGGTFPLQNPSEVCFDLNKILVGAQGTLGITTEMTLKLIPDNKHSKLVVIFMNNMEPLGRLVDEILTLNPETLETYDDKTMMLAVRFFPDFLKNKGFVKMIKFMFSFLPELWMMISSLFGGGFPKIIILAEFAGDDEKIVQEKCLQLIEKIKSFKLKVHITRSEAEAGKYWDIRRESFALLRKHVKGMRTAPFIDDIIVRPEFLPKFLPELSGIMAPYASEMTSTLAGHAGDGNFHIIPLMDFKRPDTSKTIIELGEKVYDLVIKYHGSITAEHNDGIIRTPYLLPMYGEKIVAIFKEIKNLFDPKNIFNPGKKVATLNMGGTKEYIVSHIAKEHDASRHV